MIELLLLISFIIHVITFVVLRHLKLNQDKPNESKQVAAQQKREIEELLAVYLLEIREENEQLLKLIDKGQKQQATVVKQEEDHSLRHPVSEPNVPSNKYEDYQPILPDDKEDSIEQSFTAQVFALMKKGYSAEAIAKKLNRGKTEIELFIKFNQTQEK